MSGFQADESGIVGAVRERLAPRRRDLQTEDSGWFSIAAGVQSGSTERGRV